MFKRLINIFIIIALIFSFSLGDAQQIFASTDVTSPVLESIEVTPKAVTVGDEVEVKVKLNDVKYKVKQIIVSFNSPSSKTTVNMMEIRLTYDNELDEWVGNKIISDNMENGTWKFNNISIIDDSGIIQNITANLLPKGLSLDFNVENNEGDWTPPKIEHVEISPKEVAVGEIITIKAKISDDKSGVSGVSVQFYSPSYDFTRDFREVYFNYDSNQDLWVGNYKVSNEDENGTWKFHMLSTTDKNGNGSFLHNSSVMNGEMDFNVISENIIDVNNTASIFGVGPSGSREEIKLSFFIDQSIFELITYDTVGSISLKNEIGQFLTLNLKSIIKEGRMLSTSFTMPGEVEEGNWEIIDISLENINNQYYFNNFQGVESVEKFYIPSQEADSWVRNTLDKKIEYELINLSPNNYSTIGDFIKKFRLALPPFVEKVTYDELMKYATLKEDPYGDAVFIYEWWKEGIISSLKTPPVPIFVYNHYSEGISFKLQSKIDWYVADVLHYVPNLNKEDSKITAIIESPDGKEYEISNFKYDPKFSVYDPKFYIYDIGYKVGGWRGTFELPALPLNGNWKIDRLIVDNEGEDSKTYINGIDFYGASIKLIDAFEPTSDSPIPIPTKPEEQLPPTSPPVNVFRDVSNNYGFIKEILYLLDKGIITGYKDYTFRPNEVVTRGSAAIMIGRALGLEKVVSETAFTDVNQSTVAAGYIAAAVNKGIIKGFDDNTYRPDEIVTRGQMAILINRAFDISSASPNTFKDMNSSMASFDAVSRISSLGIASGYIDNTYRPNELLNRGQFSAFLARAVNPSFIKK
ncbi:S-layer homology domain-containing protein [Psychrobacillus sp. OK028]|uniref:S-layer homology domain-containing protein n=1 Tax=Psychrobacillus sp. OK028 TaxID=1884359 RepID=UPI00088D4630|nr:S-layer homology domain-containing protein [Psychrobacillus sp. OK028]SDM73975.1 S-layer homology domain-containing protein [Psychrobacillus sp. OK028]